MRRFIGDKQGGVAKDIVLTGLAFHINELFDDVLAMPGDFSRCQHGLLALIG
jgi:hypothetical protein